MKDFYENSLQLKAANYIRKKKNPSQIFDSMLECICLVLMSLGKQKQPPQVFRKIKCSEEFSKFYRKTPVLETLFDKFAGLQAFRPATLLKRDSKRGAFL